MLDTHTQDIADRLSIFALGAKDTPPNTIINADGTPSQALMAYRAKQNLTLDWMVTGERPQHRHAASPKPLADIEKDATFLHGLLQGLEVLIGEADSSASPASNAAYALSSEVIRKADRLLHDISIHADAQSRGKRSRAQDSIFTLYDQWQAVRAQKAALVALNKGDDPDTPDFKALDEQEERLAAAIANTAPTSQADCVTLLEWMREDGQGAAWCDLYETARASVVAFLKGEQAHV